MRPPGAASPSAKSISGRRNSSRRLHEKISENAFTFPEVMESSTLNFKANFNFSRFFFGGGVPLRVCAVLVSLGQSLACVKISVRSTP